MPRSLPAATKPVGGGPAYSAGGSLTSDQIVGANKLRLSELDGEIIAQLFAVDGYDDVVLLQVLGHTAPTP